MVTLLAKAELQSKHKACATFFLTSRRPNCKWIWCLSDLWTWGFFCVNWSDTGQQWALKGDIGCPFSRSWYDSLGFSWKVYNILWLKFLNGSVKQHPFSLSKTALFTATHFGACSFKCKLSLLKLALSSMGWPPVLWDCLSVPIMGYERFIFWFWESPTTGWPACKVKIQFHCLIICIYFYVIKN